MQFLTWHIGMIVQLICIAINFFNTKNDLYKDVYHKHSLWNNMSVILQLEPCNFTFKVII